MDSLKEAVCRAIDDKQDEIFAIGEKIAAHPELGYKENQTSALVTEAFQKLGLADLSHPAITGVKAWGRGKDHKANVAVMGELDAVLSPLHPCADKETGAAHACGHNTQIAAMLGCAAALLSSGVLKELDGDVCFLATPAEEYIEIEKRLALMKEGKISYLGGKQEMIAEGAFNDVDMAMMTHSETNAPSPRIVVEGPASGFIGKTIQFIGKEAHAGGAPWEGINALNAASLAIMAVNSQRETFRDEDGVRFHPIITKGGDLVNTVPADVRMESYVRAMSVEAMQNANAKVNRAIKGAAYAIGAEVKLNDMPGYLPLHQNEIMSGLCGNNAAALLGESAVAHGLTFCGSTDAGDLGYVLPLIQPTVSGFSGAAHSKDFHVSDKNLAYLIPAKLMAMNVIDLLSNGAQKALAVKAAHPHKTPEEYKALWNKILG